MGIVNYRVVRGYGGAIRAVEHMSLDSDAEALDWLARRWGDHKTYRVQRMSDDGQWRGVRKEKEG
jgi:hypothetical protein